MTNLINVLLLEVSVLEELLKELHRLAEKIHVQPLELRASRSLGEVVTALERLDFETCGLLARECVLGLLNFMLELVESAEIVRDVGAGLLLVQR